MKRSHENNYDIPSRIVYRNMTLVFCLVKYNIKKSQKLQNIKKAYLEIPGLLTEGQSEFITTGLHITFQIVLFLSEPSTF